MAKNGWGGPRPNSGRPRTQLKARERLENIIADAKAVYGKDRIKDPLDVLVLFGCGIDPLGVRNEEVLDPRFRAECMGKVLPFLHSKLVSVDQTLAEDRRIEIVVSDSFGKVPLVQAATSPALTHNPPTALPITAIDESDDEEVEV